MAEDMTEKPTEGTTSGGRYLTRKYLVRNLQNFWNKIKVYIADKVEGLESALSKKVDQVDGQGLSTNDFTTTERDKLAGIDENANNYSHPTDSGNKHIPSGGQKGQILRWSSDGTAMWGNDSNTTYSEATQDAAGLLSADDKKKLDKIEAEANKTTVESNISSGSNNPVQCKAVKEALALKADKTELDSKADKEPEPIDSSKLVQDKTIQGYATGKGQIVLNFPKSIKHLKIHTPESNRPIEKVSLWETNTLRFTNFRTENNTWAVTLENPKGTEEAIAFNESFSFYIEVLEEKDKPKYRPFILQVTGIEEDDPTVIRFEITKVF